MGRMRRDCQCCWREVQCGQRTKIHWTKTAHNTRICTCISGHLGLVLIHTHSLELCADELVVSGGVGWSYDRRRYAFFIGGGGVAIWSAAAASDRMREHWNSELTGQWTGVFFWFYSGQPLHLWSLLGRWRRKVNCEYACCAQFHSRNEFLEAHINAMLSVEVTMM